MFLALLKFMLRGSFEPVPSVGRRVLACSFAFSLLLFASEFAPLFEMLFFVWKWLANDSSDGGAAG
jgi:hypothetical protein